MPLSPLRSTLRTFLLASTIALAAPAVASAASTLTVNGITVTVENAGRNDIRSTASGFEVEVDRHRVVFDNGTLRVDGKQVGSAIDPSEVTIDAKGWGLEVFVDGRSVHRISEIEALTASANQGNATAMNNLGVRYLRGRGVEKDPARAIEYYRMAADKGLAMAQSNLAHIYWRGQHAPQDKFEAIRLARLAAEGGNVPAMSLLGIALVKGEGTSKNATEGVFWLRKAAEQGNRAAMNDLAIRYARGEGVPKDYAQAAEWYRKAADAGSVVAKSNLAFAYWRGRGVERDLDKAEELFKAAADAGNKIAGESLAKLRAERGSAGPVSQPPANDGRNTAGRNDNDDGTGLPPTARDRTGTTTGTTGTTSGTGGAGTPPRIAAGGNDGPPPLPPTGMQVFVAVDGQQKGPFDEAMLKDLVGAGSLSADTLVWMKGMANWQKAGDVADLSDILAANTADIPPPNAPELPDIEVYAMIGGAQEGPLPMVRVVDMIRAKQITPETMVWFAGMQNWTEARKTKELGTFFDVAADGPGPVKPATAGIRVRSFCSATGKEGIAAATTFEAAKEAAIQACVKAGGLPDCCPNSITRLN